MNISAAEIREKRFRTKVMGYDAREVKAFISMMADHFEELLKEVNDLKDEARRRNSDLELYMGREESIRKTMMAAQKVCDDMKKNAEKECQIMLSEAELKADKLLAEADRKLALISSDITEIKRQKVKFEESLRSLLSTHFKMLELSKEDQTSVKAE